MSAFPMTRLVARGAAGATRPVATRLRDAEEIAVRWLVAHSIAILRVSLGAVFLGFGLLKFAPVVSPAEDGRRDR